MSAAAPAAAVMVETLEDGRIQLSGGTYPLKDQIRAHGGRWNPAARVWTLPAGTDTAFVGVAVAALDVRPKSKAEADRELCDRFAAEYAARKAEEKRKFEELVASIRASGVVIAPTVPTRRGPCCKAAEAFWPDTGPYSHYGPCHYRCPHHGESRDTYSGT